MNRIWGLYWRYLISISSTVFLLTFFDSQFALMNNIDDTGLWPSAFWGVISLVLLVVTAVQPNGVTYIVFGKRLQLTDLVWRQFNLILQILLINLVWLGFAASQVFSLELWSIYKLYVQPAILLVAPLLGAWWVNQKVKEDKTR
jgi:intracellular septation protein A